MPKSQKISKKSVPKKPTIPVPFYGHVEEGWCKGVRKNHKLYTQCTKSPQTGEKYCKVCGRQAKNNATLKPNCGNIEERKNMWDGHLNYQPDGMSKEIPYANIMNKLEITRKQVENEVNILGWGNIPECHFIDKSEEKTPEVDIVIRIDCENGKPKKIPIDENEPVKTTNPYTLSKKIAEDLCHFYYENYGVKVIILRPFNVYGPNQKEHFLIPSIIKQINLTKKINVKDLKPKRDFVYVKDLVVAILKSIELKKNFEIVNIASGKSHSVYEVIKTIQKIKGSNLKIKSTDEIRVDEIMDTRANIKKAKKILGWSPVWKFEKAIQDIYESKQ